MPIAILLLAIDAGTEAAAVGIVGGLAWLAASLWVFSAILICRGDLGNNRFCPPPARVKP